MKTVKTVLDDRIVEIPKEAMPKGPKSGRYLKENAPGPDRSPVTGDTSDPEGRHFCPFMEPVE